MLFYFYCITNLINQKIYVGITMEPSKRWRYHKTIAKGGKEKYPKISQYIHSAISKYGIDNFTFEISKVFTNEDEAYLYEEDQINYMKFLKVPMYNIAPGGKGARPGEKHPRFGIKLSPETLIKMSKVMIGKMSGNKNPMFGKFHSEKAKQAVSIANTGRIRSEEFKKTVSLSLIGRISPKRKLTDEQIREIRLLINEGISNTEIAKKFKVIPRTIRNIKNNIFYKEII